MEGTGRRNAHLLAIAPNANSSIICGTSPSIEQLKANAYTHRTRAGSHLVKNKYLAEELEKVGKNTDKVWQDIITNGGSVQHLKFLSDSVKEVFKTAIELDQNVLVKQGGERQRFLCQGQSLNLFFRPDVNIKYLHAVHFLAWKQGLKTLYYCRSEKLGKADRVSKRIEREVIKELDFQSMIDGDNCVACEG